MSSLSFLAGVILSFENLYSLPTNWESNMSDDEAGNDLDPILRSELPMLEIQLKNGTIEEKMQALDRLPELGRVAKPLIPVVLSMVGRQSPWLTPSALVRLLKATGDEIIVQALRKSNFLEGLGIYDQVDCFRYGAEELEDNLRLYIWQHRHTPGEPARPEVVKALGEKGGQESLKMMRALSVELSEYNELHAKTILEDFENKAQVSLREQVCKSIKQLEERGIRV